MNRSQQSSRYGRLAEEKAASSYGLSLDHSTLDGVRVDARDAGGNPWDVKAAMSNRKTGPGRFRLWKDQHDVLKANGGGYVFVYYRAVDGGIRIHGMRSLLAEQINVRWGGSGNHPRKSKQAKILATEIIQ